jgi:hypothetical protein
MVAMQRFIAELSKLVDNSEFETLTLKSTVAARR